MSLKCYCEMKLRLEKMERQLLVIRKEAISELLRLALLGAKSEVTVPHGYLVPTSYFSGTTTKVNSLARVVGLIGEDLD